MNSVLIHGGKTIAVIASGFNKIDPEENKYLYNQILESGGCIVTEYSEDTKSDSKYFSTRNRLISGLALGTLVIEANYRSGTGITARYCLEQERKLFCIPNSIGSKNSIGTNNLLKKGAHLVTCVKDIIDELGPIENKIKPEINITPNILNEKELKLNKEELEIYNNLKKSPKVVDEIVRCTGLEISKINVILSILEIEDYIVKLSNNKYMVINNE